MSSRSSTPLSDFVEGAREQSVPAPRIWAVRLTLNLPQTVRQIRWAFYYAEELDSEHHGYEAINEGFRIPLRLYSLEGHRRLHWIPQGMVEFRVDATRRDIEIAKDPTFPPPDEPSSATPMQIETRSMARARLGESLDAQAPVETNTTQAPAAPHGPSDELFDDVETTALELKENQTFASSALSYPSTLTSLTASTASAAYSAAATTSSEASSALVEWKSHRLTDFLLAISGFNAEGISSRRGLVAVVEAKKMPPYNKANKRDELSVAATEARSALPQLTQQARFALHQYPNQDAIWGIIVVGRCCQFYKFYREDFPELQLEDKYERVFCPEDGKTIWDYVELQGWMHRMIEPKKGNDRYTRTYMDHFHDMMAWSEELL